MIEDGSHINVFGERWMVDCKLIAKTDSPLFNLFLRVLGLMVVGTKTWNSSLIDHLFVPSVTGYILKTPLFNIVNEDQRIWWLEPCGVYIVRSAYMVLMERVLNTSYLHVEGMCFMEAEDST